MKTIKMVAPKGLDWQQEKGLPPTEAIPKEIEKTQAETKLHLKKVRQADIKDADLYIEGLLKPLLSIIFLNVFMHSKICNNSFVNTYLYFPSLKSLRNTALLVVNRVTIPSRLINGYLSIKPFNKK